MDGMQIGYKLKWLLFCCCCRAFDLSSIKHTHTNTLNLNTVCSYKEARVITHLIHVLFAFLQQALSTRSKRMDKGERHY